MTLSETSQRKSELNGSIVSTLLEIKALTGLNKFQIAEKIGVKKSTIYRGVSGKGGSPQLLAGLELLLKDIKNQKRIGELEQALRTVNTVTYPAHDPKHFELNEPRERTSSTVPASGSLVLSPDAESHHKAMAADDARRKAADKPGPSKSAASRSRRRGERPAKT